MDELRPLSNGQEPENTFPSAPPPYPPPHRRRLPLTGVAVALILLGIALFAVGWLSGSRGGRIYFDRGIRVETGTREELAQTGSLTFANNFDSLVVSTSSRSIRILPSDDQYVRAFIPVGVRSEIAERGSTLYIDTRVTSNRRQIQFMGFGGSRGVTWNRYDGSRYLNFDFDFANPRHTWSTAGIRVYVPDSVNDINARASSGSVRLYDVSTTQLRMQTTSGRVEVNGGTHHNTHLQSTSGSVVANGHFLEDLYARTTSGRVRIDDYNAAPRPRGEIQLRSTSGSVRFNTAAPLSNFSYRLSVTSGSMRVNDSRISGRSASGGTTGGTPVNASTTSGGVRLNFSQ